MSMPQTNHTTPPSRQGAALLISPAERDHQILGNLFREQNWTLYSAHSLGSACAMLRRRVVPVVITERDLPDGDWRGVLEAVHSLPSPPLVIVTSLKADERLWAEALNLGAYDVLAKPFSRTELIRVLGSVWIRCKPTSNRSRAPEPPFAGGRPVILVISVPLT